jgi:hypothetical protein
MDIHKLADMADKVMEVATPTIAAVSGVGPDHIETSEIKHLREELSRLATLVASLTTQSRSRSRSPRSRRSPSPAPALSPAHDKLWWYYA